MRGRLVEDRIEERICKIRVIDGVIANYYPQEELIRCKDCRWHWRVTESRVSGYCENDKCFDGFHFETDNDFYCGYAERKEDGELYGE